jgi:acetoin utilization deacetylase AcuC-like enzyme
VNESIQFLKEFNPDIVIVCAGYDALGSDEMAGVSIQSIDLIHAV